jgi:hypothetical protein
MMYVSANEKAVSLNLHRYDAAMTGKPGEEMKMVLVVNDALGMSAGKIAAQCCHATLAVYQSLEGRHKNVLRQW